MTLFNSITANARRGIRNAARGNFALPPPSNLLLRDATLRGRVDQVLLPPGSTVQVFADAGAQGEVFLGEGPVQNDNTFTVRGMAPPPVKRLNLTVTHATHGSTSEFGASFEVDAEFRVERLARPPGSPAPRPGATDVPVLSLQVSTRNADVVVTSVQFQTEGTLRDATDVVGVQLYRDTNADGAVSAGDVLLGGPVTYNADDGSVTIPLDGAIISASSSQRWLLVYTLATQAPVGTSFTVRVVDASAVEARTAFPIGAQVLPRGAFPLVSEVFTVLR